MKSALLARMVYWSVQAEGARNDALHALVMGSGLELILALDDYAYALGKLRTVREMWEALYG